MDIVEMENGLLKNEESCKAWKELQRYYFPWWTCETRRKSIRMLLFERYMKRQALRLQIRFFVVYITGIRITQCRNALWTFIRREASQSM